FQRCYELRGAVLPDWDDAHAPPLQTVYEHLTYKAVLALGIATARWLPDYFRLSSKATLEALATLVQQGAVLPVQVEGWPEPAYIATEQRPLAEAAAAGALEPTTTTLLSPFDPLVWHRARAVDLFNFHYRIECYTPAHKRQYGYFTLPILWRGHLVGRLDPKAHRKAGVFEVKALHLEPWVTVTDELLHDIAGALRRCAAWHRTPQVVVRFSDPPTVREGVLEYIEQVKEQGQ
ncbi:MAG: winged helix-turn-helix domain-containing protein, partial [Chloroflexaceae bacterium]|nr:winged helix-turn-helix domain-containing protein [Chloroflexaceae bacterium]